MKVAATMAHIEAIQDENDRLKSENAFYKREIKTLTEKCAWLNKNELKTWLLTNNPRSFRIAVPAGLSSQRLSEERDACVLATTREYIRRDIFDLELFDKKIADMVGDQENLYQTINLRMVTELQDLESMYQEHHAALCKIRELQEALRQSYTDGYDRGRTEVFKAAAHRGLGTLHDGKFKWNEVKQ